MSATRSTPAARRRVAFAFALLALAAGGACGKSGDGTTVAPPGGGNPLPAPADQSGETATLAAHFTQADIDAGLHGLGDLVQHGERLFAASFNTLDGAGRPGTTGTGQPRVPRFAPQNFNRISGPDANRCADCHAIPFLGGGGDNSANVFVLAERFPSVNFDGGAGDDFQDLQLDDVGLERATVGLFGSGFIELLAREMTAELHAVRDLALSDASLAGAPVTRALVTKGVEFGEIDAFPDGSLDTTRVDGIDADLVVKPFHQKGVVASLREFTNTAANQHHGMQSTERFGEDTDADGDGVVNELTTGDITALTIFQATLRAPGRVLPSNGGAGISQAVVRGEQRFADAGCTSCHVPFLVLDDPVFTEPGPYNRPGDLQPGDVPQPFAVDLSAAGTGPSLSRQADGTVRVPAYTDLKRHEMGPVLDNETLAQEGVPTSVFLTKRLWGMATEPPFMHHGRALTLREAIEMHGGEADLARQAFEALPPVDQDELLEFLLTLRVLVPSATTHELVVPGPGPIGEVPAIAAHVDQHDIDAGVHTAEEVFDFGSLLFDLRFNTLDGAGRPETTGAGLPRPRREAPQNFNRVSAPESSGCISCHNFPRGTAGGGNVHNVIARGEELDFVNFDGLAGDGDQSLHLDDVGNERASVGLHGAGILELLAREMTVDLRSVRDQALAAAQLAGTDVTLSLRSKGVDFGAITAGPSGSIDRSGVEGVDDDLIVRPFHQKGVTVSLREFTNTAMNQHHGMQSTERFGVGVDHDVDGVVDELSEGDITALAIYQAMQAIPGRRMPSDPGERAVVDAGEVLFDAIGCTVCHVAELVLDDPVFTEPGPFNPPGNLTPSDVPQPFAVDLATEGRLPRLPREPDGTVHVPAYTDLRRHDLGPGLAEPLPQGGAAREEFLTKRLWGMANEPPYLHHGRALTITEAILLHGGEAQASRDTFAALAKDERGAVVRFLKTLQLLPKGSPLVVFE
jgi:CxxC motif-containing protein (DUF1111 family)